MENKLRKFKLVDRDGFINRVSENQEILSRYLKQDCLIGRVDEQKGLMSLDIPSLPLISYIYGEFKYFEEVPLEQEQQYWKENTLLEKSLLVGKKCQGDKPFQVEHVGEEIVLLKEVGSGKESCTTKDNLKSLLPDEDEILFQRVLSSWQGVSLDNAYDHRGSVVNLEKFYLVVKEVFDEHYKS